VEYNGKHRISQSQGPGLGAEIYQPDDDWSVEAGIDVPRIEGKNVLLLKLVSRIYGA
jgi:hypothetical protein